MPIGTPRCFRVRHGCRHRKCPGVPGPNNSKPRIQVLDCIASDATIALIGHELQHAAEVAAAPDVKDQAGLASLYKRIGEPGGLAHSFDTRAAQNTGQRVRLELVS
jgi:hypothetical protein